MKILTNDEYKALVAAAEGKTVDEDPRIKELEAELKKSHTNYENLQREKSIMEEDHTIALKRKDEATASEVAKKTATLEKEKSELTIKLNAAEKEAEILNKAFENLGFDVKDMKDILNKLVDGIVSKNQIQLVK